MKIFNNIFSHAASAFLSYLHLTEGSYNYIRGFIKVKASYSFGKDNKHVIQKNGLFVSERNYDSLEKTIQHIINNYKYSRRNEKKWFTYK